MQYKIANNIFKYSTTILISYCFLISRTVHVYSVLRSAAVRCMLFIYDAQELPTYICRKEEKIIYIQWYLINICVYLQFL